MSRDAKLYFLAALLFVASAVIDLVSDNALDLGDWLALVAAAIFAILGIQAARPPQPPRP